MLQLKDLQSLGERYAETLVQEYEAKVTAERLRECTLAEGYENGEIDGKNAQVREVQTAVLLANNYDLTQADLDAARASAGRKHIEALIGLTKAWLYSQTRTG